MTDLAKCICGSTPQHESSPCGFWVSCGNGDCGVCGPIASCDSGAAEKWDRLITGPRKKTNVTTLWPLKQAAMEIGLPESWLEDEANNHRIPALCILGVWMCDPESVSRALIERMERRWGL